MTIAARATRRTTIAVGVLATIGVLCSAAPAAAGSAADQADRRLERALGRLVDRAGGPPGIAAVVQRGDDRRLHTAGSADVDSGAPIALDDHLRIASTSKAFNGAVALHLVASGSLALDDTIGARLPSLPAAWSAVTLRQLLQHTSGIPDFSQTPAFQRAVVDSLQLAPPPAQLLAYVAEEPLLFDPGTEYAYSNSDNVVVALMVEAVTGDDYAAELDTRVLGPLGLSRTSLPRDSVMPTPTVHGYEVDPPAAPEDVTTLFAAGWAWSSGGMVSTPTDSNAFIRVYVRGDLTNAATRDAQRTFVPGRSEPPGPGKNAAGLALFRYRTSCGTVYGHTGNTAGYTQFIAADGDGRRSVSVSVNAQVSPDTNAKVFRALRTIYQLGVCAALA